MAKKISLIPLVALSAFSLISCNEEIDDYSKLIDAIYSDVIANDSLIVMEYYEESTTVKSSICIGANNKLILDYYDIEEYTTLTIILPPEKTVPNKFDCIFARGHYRLANFTMENKYDFSSLSFSNYTGHEEDSDRFYAYRSFFSLVNSFRSYCYKNYETYYENTNLFKD